jgi:cold shock CspA family protein
MVNEALTRIGIFYDGSFFNMVSNYYVYHHARGARLSIGGLHEFIRKRVAQEELRDVKLCRIVDIHYFRGRFSAEETNDAGKLLAERTFDDVLMREGVTTHYLPMDPSGGEKGIDVWFALETYELALHKHFDVCVLIACDSDYLPLIRKLNALGTRVMLLGFDFEYTDLHARPRKTKTAQAMLREATYPVLMSALIDDKSQNEVVRELFLAAHDNSPRPPPTPAHAAERVAQTARARGKIQNVITREAENRRFGFISPDGAGDNLWFGEQDVENAAFDTLKKGDAVSYELGTNALGVCAKHVRRDV